VFEIGNSLREARLRQGLEFVEIEQATKIRGKYLRALEDEQFDILPGQTYVKGFLRTYAEYLGLDGQLYVDEYNSRYIPGDEETPLRAQNKSTVGRNPRVESSVVLVALAAIGILTALVVLAWRFGSDPPETAIPDFSSQPPAETRAKVPARKSSRPAAPIARLTITGALGDSWVEVHARSAAGPEIYRGTLVAGSTIRFVRHRRLHVVMGRPGNLRLKVNGRVREVPGRGTTTAVVITARRVIPVRAPA
jgi:cytoskeleton protein RodZ